jgi:DNA primase catalytic core
MPPPDTAAAHARSERLEALHRQLADGVAAIRDGASWRAWLDVAARFHRYSFNNQVLIAAQKPDATLVAGYRTWQGMGRQVRKGEQALWILAPVTSRRRAATDEPPLEDFTGTTSLVEPRAPTAGAEGNRRVLGFRGAPVFDVTQTEGEPLPAAPRPQLLAGQAPPGMWDALTEVVTARGFSLARSEDASTIGGANGVTDFAARTVTIRADVDDAQASKTLAHEAAHVLLHDPADPAAPQLSCRGLVEVEAESVAYLVAAHHGLDTAGYTFAYIAGWAGRDDTAVQDTATRVLHVARTLIDATDAQVDDQLADGPALRISPTLAASAVSPDAATKGAVQPTASGPDRQQVGTLRAITAASQAWFLEGAAGNTTFATAVVDRGHSVEAVLNYGVGYAPEGWTALSDHLRALGFSAEAVVAAGVALRTRRGHLIDRFRGRVTFPIHDEVGVVGFTARDLTGSPRAPKYLNTPSTQLYDKSRLLFGTQHLVRDTPTVVLTEGPWDALAVSASTDAVGLAACGTAVTEAHLRMASGHGRRLILAPDPDAAGVAALDRTLAIVTRLGLPHPDALVAPGHTDLADVHAHQGPAALRRLLTEASPGALAYAQAYLTLHPPGDAPEERVAVARRAAAHASALGPVHRSKLPALLQERAGLTAEAALAIASAPHAAPPPGTQREVGTWPVTRGISSRAHRPGAQRCAI